jgi:ribonucleoside-diphosphate reductase subunit M1
MSVVKRDGRHENIQFDKIVRRIKTLADIDDGLEVDILDVAQKVINGVHKGIRTVELDTLTCEICAQLITTHPDYDTLASRVFVSSIHKETPKKFSDFVNTVASELSDQFVSDVRQHADALDAAIEHSRDYDFTYLGLKTLEKSYLTRHSGKIVERPQYLFMRVAVAIHGSDIDRVKDTYTRMSLRQFIHATPTLYNAGRRAQQQLSSCFLLQVIDDSIEGIFETVKQCAIISKSAGGIGLAVSNVRASGSLLSNGGKSSGIVPLLRVINNVSRYVDNGGSKRSGAIAIYLEPWHRDVFEFLDLRKNHGSEELRTRDLFTALWVPDLFMERVMNEQEWSLFCPSDAPGLDKVWGDDFKKLYEEYEKTKPRRAVRARTLWDKIVSSQIETGTPYMLYKDTCNRTSNHNHLGTIKGSNLCEEIIQYFDEHEPAVCNLASVGLPYFYKNKKSGFDYAALHDTVRVMTRNLDNVISISHCPTAGARRSNEKHRPMGIGVQGLADVFVKCGIEFDSDAARELNKNIFETIYHAALTESAVLASERGVYESFPGSRVSRGMLHCHEFKHTKSGMWDWEAVYASVERVGLRNSLLVAPMPTATTSHILGYSECTEPYTSNFFVRRVSSGEFQVVNSALVRQLINLDLWDANMKNEIMRNSGSVAAIARIPQEVRRVFRTVWEIPQKAIIDMASDRQVYIDQSQSLNIYIANPSLSTLTSMHFHGWKSELKSGMYYLRTLPAVNSIQFTVPVEEKEIPACEIGCVSCSA